MSSSFSSSSSSTPVSDLISQWGTSCISSCVLGLSKIGMTSNISNKFSHAALLLLKKEIDYDEDDDSAILNEFGILIEYGNYKLNEVEKNKLKKGIVVYRYGDQGGLRYYIKKYKEFIEEFGEIGYIDLNIHADNQTTFDVFIDKIARLEENKWIQSNYSTIDFNCQTFVIKALGELKPYFNSSNIFPKDPNLAAKKSKKKLDFIPTNIKDALNEFYKK